MAYTTRSVPVTSEWSLITDKLAYIQFNDAMRVVINDGATPTGRVGVEVDAKEEYVNPNHGLHVWAISLKGGTNLESVTVIEDV